MKLKPIKNDRVLNRALQRIEELWGTKPGTLRGDELDILMLVVEKYEEEQFAIPESVRLAIVKIDGSVSRYGEIPNLPLTIFINPEITVLEDAESSGYWEGCLSVPGLRGFVERPQHVRVDYLDHQGRERSPELQGLLATVIQHEFDHLDGRLFVDRMTDLRKLAFENEFERYPARRTTAEILD